jgi:hypothetical protein
MRYINLIQYPFSFFFLFIDGCQDYLKFVPPLLTLLTLITLLSLPTLPNIFTLLIISVKLERRRSRRNPIARQNYYQNFIHSNFHANNIRLLLNYFLIPR